MKVKFTCASRTEASQTIQTSQFEGINFKKGDKFIITLANGTKLKAYVNRKNASTLYIKEADFPANLKKATIVELGGPVTRTIKGIKKVK